MKVRTWILNSRVGLFPALMMVFMFAMPQAIAGITTTKHNLSTGGTGANHLTSGTAEICVFCHTPHGAAAAGAAKPPLWNKALPSSAGYTTYSSASSSTIDGNVSLANSVSLACLSCHDGSQAMDNMINAPGSGGYNANGASPAGYTWTGAAIMPSSVALLGTDLSNDHPVAIQYCGGGLTGSGTTVSGTCTDSDFKNGSNDVKTKQVGSTQLFWVDTGVSNGTREKTDLPLYNNSGNTGPSVECASCHDPHSDTNATFLRVANTGSAVCLTCHVK